MLSGDGGGCGFLIEAAGKTGFTATSGRNPD